MYLLYVATKRSNAVRLSVPKVCLSLIACQFHIHSFIHSFILLFSVWGMGVTEVVCGVGLVLGMGGVYVLVCGVWCGGVRVLDLILMG